MERFLFTDGTGEIKEVQSKAELDSLINAAPSPDRIRIWLFSSNEWISWAAFSKNSRAEIKKNIPVVTETNSIIPVPRKRNWLTKTLFFTLAGTSVFLVYNFTRIKWSALAPLNVQASRPANVPIINNDSLVAEIEFARAQKLDKVTRTNLRIRNNWPENVLLHLAAKRETNGSTISYNNINITLDNATGYQVDEATVKLTVWKKGQEERSDTVQFNNIGYTTPAKRDINESYQGDSLSVSFYSIKARAFNFCYSADKQSNYGNMADRWFCK
jgi:hypothetical protein